MVYWRESTTHCPQKISTFPLLLVWKTVEPQSVIKSRRKFWDVFTFQWNISEKYVGKRYIKRSTVDWLRETLLVKLLCLYYIMYIYISVFIFNLNIRLIWNHVVWWNVPQGRQGHNYNTSLLPWRVNRIRWSGYTNIVHGSHLSTFQWRHTSVSNHWQLATSPK